MSLRSLNLNLLPVLQALLRERSVSVAADMLAMSQSAASEALAKLRATFDDPLLVRVGQRMELTPRAQMLVEPLDALCLSLEEFHRRPVFDALNAERAFTIAGNDYAIYRVGPAMMTALCGAAPGVSLRFVAGTSQLVSQLVAGDMDFALLPQFLLADLPPGLLHSQKMFVDRAVAIFDRRHPLAARTSVGKEDLHRYRMVAYHPGTLRFERRHLHAFTGGQSYRVAASVPEVALTPALIRGSDHFAIVPEKLPGVRELHPDIVSRPLDYAMPQLEVALAWGPLQDTDSGHRWLRELILRSVAECDAPPR